MQKDFFNPFMKTQTKQEQTAQDSKQKTSTSSKQLLEIALDGTHYFNSIMEQTFVSLTINGYKETYKINSETFKSYLKLKYFNKYQKIITNYVLDEIIKLLQAKALFEGPTEQVFKRVAQFNDMIFIDICDRERHVIQITQSGWSIVQNPPVHFIRRKLQQPLVLPKKGGNILDLKKFVNLKDDADFLMLISWLLRSLCPKGPYPILVIKGGQGTAKSTLLKICRELVDPSSSPIRTLSKNERDLFISASNTWMIAFDNVSECPDNISDTLCSISTSGSFATRALYFDEEENVINAFQPIAIAGITNLAKRGDLVERSIILNLPKIVKRQSEVELWASFKEKLPYILGALCDITSYALKNIKNVKADNLPRMADFAQWILAAEEALPFEHGAFLNVYIENQKNIMDLALEADPIALAVLSLMKNHQKWEDTPTNTLNALELQSVVTQKIKASKSWPSAANKLREHLERAEPFLNEHGIEIDLNRKKHGTKQFIFKKTTMQTTPSTNDLDTSTTDEDESYFTNDAEDENQYQSIFDEEFKI